MEKLAAFIAEIRSAPGFIAAAREDPIFILHLANIERGFQAAVSLMKISSSETWSVCP